MTNRHPRSPRVPLFPGRRPGQTAPPRRVRGRAALLAALAVALPVAAAGETAAPEAGFGGLEQEILFGEIPSVYAASKYEQKITEAPAAVSVVTAEEIQKYGYRTLAQILGSLPGFYVSYDRNYDYTGVRGFNRPGDYSTRLLLLIDGHRLNDPVYHSVPVGTELPLDVELIERVEVIRGPASSLYGTNAFLGVVNVVTKDGRDVNGVQAAGGYGSNDSPYARLTYGEKFAAGPELLLSGSYAESDGERRLYYPEFDDPDTGFGVARDSDGDRYYSLFGEISYLGAVLQAGHGHRKKVIPTGAYETVFPTPSQDTWTTDRYVWVDLSYQHSFDAGWNLSARATYDHYRYVGKYFYDYSETDEPDLVVNRDDAWGDQWGGDVSVNRNLFGRAFTTLGASFEHGVRLEQANFDVGPFFSYLDDDRDSFDWALYAQSEIHIFDQLTAFAGMRYDHEDSYGANFSPRVALVYHPFESTALKFIYGQAFRAPSPYELYYNDGGEFLKANADLDQERIRTFDFVVEQEIGEHLHFATSLYYSQIDDLIEQVIDPSDDLVVFDNRGEVDAMGAEFWLAGHWESGVEGRISYTLQRAEDETTGNRLTNSPTHMAKLNLVVPLWFEWLFAGAEVQYMSSRKTVQGLGVDDFVVTNLTLLGKQLLPGLDIRATVRNLFDEDYSDPGTFDHVQNAIPQDGRGFFVQLSYDFLTF